MPGRLSPKQERMWKQAKAYVAKSKGKSQSTFHDRDWGLVQHIFQAIKKKYGEGRIPSDYAEQRSRSLFDFKGYKKRLESAARGYCQLISEALAVRQRHDLMARGLGDIKGIQPGLKDVARMHDIVTKSGGDVHKMMVFVRNMAKAIGDKDKAERRASAALRILPDEIAMDAAQEFLSKF